jgi:hypothetical protein
MLNSTTLSKFLILSSPESMKLFARLRILIEISPLVSFIVLILLLLKSISSNDDRLHKPSKTVIKFPERFSLRSLTHLSSLSIFLILFDEISIFSSDFRSPSP